MCLCAIVLVFWALWEDFFVFLIWLMLMQLCFQDCWPPPWPPGSIVLLSPLCSTWCPSPCCLCSLWPTWRYNNSMTQSLIYKDQDTKFSSGCFLQNSAVCSTFLLFSATNARGRNITAGSHLQFSTVQLSVLTSHILSINGDILLKCTWFLFCNLAEMFLVLKWLRCGIQNKVNRTYILTEADNWLSSLCLMLLLFLDQEIESLVTGDLLFLMNYFSANFSLLVCSSWNFKECLQKWGYMVEFIFYFNKTWITSCLCWAWWRSIRKRSFDTCPILFPCSTGGFAAHVVRALPHQDQQLPLPGGMMQPGTNDQRGEDCGSFTLNSREGERAHSQWGHVVITRSCFPPIFCENPQKDTSVWITNAPTRLIFGPYILRPHLCFISASAFLFISSSL